LKEHASSEVGLGFGWRLTTIGQGLSTEIVSSEMVFEESWRLIAEGERLLMDASLRRQFQQRLAAFHGR
jgi:hypothetical protein